MCDYTITRPSTEIGSGYNDLFVVSGGYVVVLGLVGTVTVAIDDDGSDSTDVRLGDTGMLSSGVTSHYLTNQPIGYRMGGLVSDGGVLLGEGDTAQTGHGGDAPTAGEFEWTLWYRPVTAGAVVTAA